MNTQARIDVRYYNSMRYGRRPLPVVPGWYAEITDQGDITAIGPFRSMQEAFTAAHEQFVNCPGPACMIVGADLVNRKP